MTDSEGRERAAGGPIGEAAATAERAEAAQLDQEARTAEQRAEAIDPQEDQMDLLAIPRTVVSTSLKIARMPLEQRSSSPPDPTAPPTRTASAPPPIAPTPPPARSPAR